MGRFSWQVVARSGLPQAWKPLHFPLGVIPDCKLLSPLPLVFGGATNYFDAAWDAASLCPPPPPPGPPPGRGPRGPPRGPNPHTHTQTSLCPPPPPGLPQSSMRSAAHAGYSISICKSISIRTRNPVRARSRRVGCSTALRVPESRARAARARAARSCARLLSILRPGSNPRSHWCGRARHWEGAATGGGSKLVERRGPLSAGRSRKGGKSRGRRAAVPETPAPDPCPRPQHARPAGVTGSARSRPAAQPGSLAGHSDRRPGAMSHEAARQHLPAADPDGLQPSRRLLRPRPLPRRPGAGPRAALPPAPRPSPATCARHLIPAPCPGGRCAQRWVWPVPFALPSPRGPGEEREGHAGACNPDEWVPSLAFERLPVHLSTLVRPKPRFMLVHFWKSVSVAFTKDPFQ